MRFVYFSPLRNRDSASSNASSKSPVADSFCVYGVCIHDKHTRTDTHKHTHHIKQLGGEAVAHTRTHARTHTLLYRSNAFNIIYYLVTMYKIYLLCSANFFCSCFTFFDTIHLIAIFLPFARDQIWIPCSHCHFFWCASTHCILFGWTWFKHPRVLTFSIASMILMMSIELTWRSRLCGRNLSQGCFPFLVLGQLRGGCSIAMRRQAGCRPAS